MMHVQIYLTDNAIQILENFNNRQFADIGAEISHVVLVLVYPNCQHVTEHWLRSTLSTPQRCIGP